MLARLQSYHLICAALHSRSWYIFCWEIVMFGPRACRCIVCDLIFYPISILMCCNQKRICLLYFVCHKIVIAYYILCYVSH
ncbi:hypothetical protein BDA96_01G160000 [Sorghum bicolor]|uniref:Uncharacterized protein n=2 Tax=Sorghum bicolor TaxID=4558 RepID=A0A1Z5S614_SORBI|nr:hypothetical protein BDA96_01G160000 [Sorghum bicolor]OQU91259.1 hypothetical protein SORBI_3001G152280 [Sorghum bicolor]